MKENGKVMMLQKAYLRFLRSRDYARLPDSGEALYLQPFSSLAYFYISYIYAYSYTENVLPGKNSMAGLSLSKLIFSQTDLHRG